MNEGAARTVLLIKAIEDTDPGGKLLPEADRRWATREADPHRSETAARTPVSGLTPEEGEFLLRRAQSLLPPLEQKFPAIGIAHDAILWRGWMSAALAVASFALGIALNELGAARRISIISFPLLGMLAWNLAVYAALLAAVPRAYAKRSRRPHAHPLVTLVTGLMRRNPLPRGKGGSASVPALRTALQVFATQWTTLAAPLLAARVQRVLHVCAALLAAGAVAGMYVRGIAFEYRAGWESTFLDAADVHALLQLALGPASAITGIALPDVGHIAALRWTATGTGENAAPWIHLYAATAVMFIVVPRLVLAVIAAVAELRLRRNFPLPEGVRHYHRNLLAARHASERTAAVEVIPYNHTLPEAALHALERALQEHTGARLVTSCVRPSVRYGDEDDAVQQLTVRENAGMDYAVLVFNMVSTPEEENHGRLLHGYRTALAKAERPQLIVVLDESGYRRRLAGQAGSQARLEERRTAWQRFAQAHGIDIVPLDLAAAAV